MVETTLGLRAKLPKTIFLATILLAIGCVPPAADADAEAVAVREPVSEMKCLQLLSSAAEYYKNKDWGSTVRVYEELVNVGCDKGSEEEVYQYWAIAFEFLGKFDSSEYVLLQGLKSLPDNLNLHNRLAYAYKRLGNKEKEIFEYERISDMTPDDPEPMKSLNNLYVEVGRYDDQIYILKKILEIEPNNKDAQGDLAQAYERTGKDPIDIYRQRFADNPENLSFGLDLSDQLTRAGEYGEAVKVLSRLRDSGSGNSSVSAKLILKKLTDAYYKTDELEKASEASERLFDMDKRDFRTVLEVTKINIELLNFGKALTWAEEAVRIAPDNGETYGHKGLVYYRAFQECREDYPSKDDKIVARLAFGFFQTGEEKGHNRFKRDRLYLEKNSDDLMFGGADWFMLDQSEKKKGSIRPTGDCYSWVKESVKKDPSWK